MKATWSKDKPANAKAVTNPEPKEKDKLENMKASAASATWSKDQSANAKAVTNPEPKAKDKLTSMVSAAEAVTWDNQTHARIKDEKSLSDMITFSTKNRWPKKEHALKMPKKPQEDS